MNANDLAYIFHNNPNKVKNLYDMKIIQHLPDIHIHQLKRNKIKHRVLKGKHRYLNSVEILRKDESVISTIKPPRYMTNSRFSSRLVGNKLKTEKHLKDHGIRTANSFLFDQNEVELAKSKIYANGTERAVIKPLSGSLGKGVMVNVPEDRFEENWAETKKFLKRNKNILVQEYLEGFEARALIIEGHLHSVTVRTPPYVIGDGSHTIDELVNLSNEEKSNCGVRSKLMIKKNYRFNEFIRINNLKLEDIPSDGEYVLLGSVSNVSNGGELVNITDVVSEEVKETALNAVASINGFYTAGIDIMIRSYDEKNPVVLEINSFPVLSISSFPTYGARSNPSQTYIRSVIAVDQFINNPDDQYQIENEEDYVRNYINFNKRRDNLFNLNHENILRYL